MALSPTGSLWTPDVQRAWIPGQRQPWQVIDRLDHPALGLRFEQLTDAFAPFGLPSGWDSDLAAQYALAVHGFISRELGTMATNRSAWAPKMRALVAVLMTGIGRQPVPFFAFAKQHHGFRDSKAWGWGTGEAGLRRLYECAQSHGELRYVDAPLGTPGWRLSGSKDFQALDRAWANALTFDDEPGFLPLLGVQACSCFAVTRRRVLVEQEAELNSDAGGVSVLVDVPSLWELIAVAFLLGSRGLKTRAQRWVAMEAQRPPGARARNRHHSQRARGSIETLVGYVNGVFNRFETVAGSLDGVAGWEMRRRIELSSELLADNPSRTEDRTAVPLTRFRRARAQCLADVERLRPTRSVATGRKERRRYTTKLRRLLMLDLLGQLGARPNEVVRLLVLDVVALHHFGDGLAAPAVFHTPSRKGSGPPVDPCMRPIAPQTHELLQEWIAWMELAPSDPLFPGWTAARVAHDFGTAAVIPLPTDPNRGYAPTRVRHLAEALGFAVGIDWIETAPEWNERISAQVLADAFLTHRMKADALGYKDLEHNRALWAARAALGAPERNVAGVHDRLLTDAGARRGWDLDAIREALRLRHAAAHRSAEAERARAIASRRASQQRSQSALGTAADLRTLTHRELLELALRRDEARDDAATADKRVAAATSMHERAQQDTVAADAVLDRLKTAGRTAPLADCVPLANELPDGVASLDTETWDEALSRATTIIDDARRTLVGGVEAADGRMRCYLNLPEFAAVCGVSERAVRAWLQADGGPNAPFPTHGPDRVVVAVGNRLRVVAVERLPAAFMNRLLREQIELMEQLLMVPMGSSRWGGRSVEIARIEARRAVI